MLNVWNFLKKTQWIWIILPNNSVLFMLIKKFIRWKGNLYNNAIQTTYYKLLSIVGGQSYPAVWDDDDAAHNDGGRTDWRREDRCDQHSRAGADQVSSMFCWHFLHKSWKPGNSCLTRCFEVVGSLSMNHHRRHWNWSSVVVVVVVINFVVVVALDDVLSTNILSLNDLSMKLYCHITKINSHTFVIYRKTSQHTA